MLSAKFTVVYLEILTVCLLFALVMRIKVSRDLGTKYEVRAFQWLLHFFMAMVVFDAVAQLQRAGFIDPHLMLMRFCNSSYMFSIAAISLICIYFSEQQISGAVAQKKRVFAASCMYGNRLRRHLLRIRQERMALLFR